MAAPYGVRPWPGATVSTPLKWSEVKRSLDPSRFTIKTMPKRLENVGDLWQQTLGEAIDLLECLERLSITVLGKKEREDLMKAGLEFIAKLYGTLKISEEEWYHAVLLKVSAMWSMQSNMKRHPRLYELVKEHSKERPKASRLLVEQWLANQAEAKE
jgi:hypothetical protein